MCCFPFYHRKPLRLHPSQDADSATFFPFENRRYRPPLLLMSKYVLHTEPPFNTCPVHGRLFPHPSEQAFSKYLPPRRLSGICLRVPAPFFSLRRSRHREMFSSFSPKLCSPYAKAPLRENIPAHQDPPPLSFLKNSPPLMTSNGYLIQTFPPFCYAGKNIISLFCLPGSFPQRDLSDLFYPVWTFRKTSCSP